MNLVLGSVPFFLWIAANKADYYKKYVVINNWFGEFFAFCTEICFKLGCWSTLIQKHLRQKLTCAEGQHFGVDWLKCKFSLKMQAQFFFFFAVMVKRTSNLWSKWLWLSNLLKKSWILYLFCLKQHGDFFF